VLHGEGHVGVLGDEAAQVGDATVNGIEGFRYPGQSPSMHQLYGIFPAGFFLKFSGPLLKSPGYRADVRWKEPVIEH